MSSPQRKKIAGPATQVVPDEHAKQNITDIFRGLIGDDASLMALHEEYLTMKSNEKRLLEKQASRIRQRQMERQSRCEAKRREDEQRRLLELRNNAANLALCAAQIQKFFKARPLQKQYETLRKASNEKVRKNAIVIIIDGFDDARIRDPTMVTQDGSDIARILQYCGFAVDVYSAKAPNPRFRPTKENISRALSEARETPPDTMLWFHICGLGGVGIVSGRNPLKSALKELSAQQTPRTRVIRALQANHRPPGATAQSGGGDVCRFIFPSDGRSARLTYDAIVSVDEVLLALLDDNRQESVFGRPLAQRIVTVDVEALGQCEGHQAGGGFGLLSSTLGPRLLFETRQGEVRLDLQEPHRGLLSATILRCLLGDHWVPRRPITSEGIRRCAMWNAPVAADDGDETVLCCTLKSITETLLHRAKLLGVPTETSGLPLWGDIPLICGAAIIGAMESIFGMVIDPALSVAMDTAKLPRQSSQSKLAAARRRAVPSAVRSCNFEVALLLSLSSVTATNTFDVDYLGTLFQWINIVCQPDPAAPVHRQLKVVPIKASLRRTVLVGITASFADVAAQERMLRAAGGDGNVWQSLVARLTKRDAQSPTHRGSPSVVGSRGVVLPPVSHPGGRSTPAAAKYAAPIIRDTSSISVTPHLASSEAFTPMLVAEHDTPVDQTPPFQVFLGRPEEGAVVVSIPVASQEDVEFIVNQLHVIPDCLHGEGNLHSLRLELSLELTGCPANVQALRDQARGWYRREAEDSTNEVHIAKAKKNPSLALVNSSHTRVTTPNELVFSDQSDDKNITREHSSDELLGAAHIDDKLMTILLERACAGTVRKPQQHIAKFISSSEVCISRITPRVQRINDLDDAAYDALRSRERIVTISMPMSGHSLGVAVCVVAMGHTPQDVRNRQAVELARTNAKLGNYYSVIFLMWDATETLWTPPTTSVVNTQTNPSFTSNGSLTSNGSMLADVNNSIARKGERLGRLLESTKGMIPSVNFPALLLLDFCKRRYYRARVPPVAGLYTEQQITAMADDFFRGMLSDMSPPVKGCRVYGGSVASTKYTLIPI